MEIFYRKHPTPTHDDERQRPLQHTHKQSVPLVLLLRQFSFGYPSLSIQSFPRSHTHNTSVKSSKKTTATLILDRATTDRRDCSWILVACLFVCSSRFRLTTTNRRRLFVICSTMGVLKRYIPPRTMNRSSLPLEASSTSPPEPQEPQPATPNTTTTTTTTIVQANDRELSENEYQVVLPNAYQYQFYFQTNAQGETCFYKCKLKKEYDSKGVVRPTGSTEDRTVHGLVGATATNKTDTAVDKNWFRHRGDVFIAINGMVCTHNNNTKDQEQPSDDRTVATTKTTRSKKALASVKTKSTTTTDAKSLIRHYSIKPCTTTNSKNGNGSITFVLRDCTAQPNLDQQIQTLQDDIRLHSMKLSKLQQLMDVVKEHKREKEHQLQQLVQLQHSQQSQHQESATTTKDLNPPPPPPPPKLALHKPWHSSSSLVSESSTPASCTTQKKEPTKLEQFLHNNSPPKPYHNMNKEPPRRRVVLGLPPAKQEQEQQSQPTLESSANKPLLLEKHDDTTGEEKKEDVEPTWSEAPKEQPSLSGPTTTNTTNTRTTTSVEPSSDLFPFVPQQQLHPLDSTNSINNKTKTLPTATPPLLPTVSPLDQETAMLIHTHEHDEDDDDDNDGLLLMHNHYTATTETDHEDHPAWDSSSVSVPEPSNGGRLKRWNRRLSIGSHHSSRTRSRSASLRRRSTSAAATATHTSVSPRRTAGSVRRSIQGGLSSLFQSNHNKDNNHHHGPHDGSVEGGNSKHLPPLEQYQQLPSPTNHNNTATPNNHNHDTTGALAQTRPPSSSSLCQLATSSSSSPPIAIEERGWD